MKTGYLSRFKRLMVNIFRLKNNPKDIYVGVKLYINAKIPNTAGKTNINSWTTACIETFAFKDGKLVVGIGEKKDFASAINFNNLRDVNDLIRYF